MEEKTKAVIVAAQNLNKVKSAIWLAKKCKQPKEVLEELEKKLEVAMSEFEAARKA